MSFGPGSELKRIIGMMGFSSCEKCTAHAIIMDEEGPDWCEVNMDLILGWLAESAKDRHLPFIRTAAKAIVNRAIASSKRKMEIMQS